MHHFASHFRFIFACFASFCFFLRSFRLRFNPLFCFLMKQFLLRFNLFFFGTKTSAYHNQSISRAVDPWIFHCIDDVTIILLLDGSFLVPSILSRLMYVTQPVAFCLLSSTSIRCRNLFKEKHFYSSFRMDSLALPVA